MPVERYSRTQIALHWVIAFLVMTTWFLSDDMDDALEAKLDGGVETPLHVWFGLAVLGLMVVRLLVRLRSPVPGAPAGSTPLMARLRHAGHNLLYVLLFAVPFGGAATWFLELDTGDIHEMAGNALLAIAMGHVCLALWHQGVKQDGTLTRMLQPRDRT